MANTQTNEVNLNKRVETSKGLRYCPVVVFANGRVKLILGSLMASLRNTRKALITCNGARTVAASAYL